jgi:hypothetical protein
MHQVVKVQPPNHPAQAVFTSKPLACNTIVTVAYSGTTGLSFSSKQLICQLDRINLVGTPQKGTLVSRNPTNAFFFRLESGRIFCTHNSATSGKALCGAKIATIPPGYVNVEGQLQLNANCIWNDPAFIVAVRVGSVRVIDPAGKGYVVRSGSQLSYNFSTRMSTVTPVVFSASDRAVFIAQARVMKLPRLPQAITFISGPPPKATPGHTYTVMVAASSGNPVQLSIASSSASVCSISSYTVTFNAVGLCVIDASQAGDAEYQAAPPARQEVKVG